MIQLLIGRRPEIGARHRLHTLDDDEEILAVPVGHDVEAPLQNAVERPRSIDELVTVGRGNDEVDQRIFRTLTLRNVRACAAS